MKNQRNSQTLSRLFFAILAVALAVAFLQPLRAAAADPITIDWESVDGNPLQPGEEISTQYAVSSAPISFTVSTVNTGGGPNKAIIFDSANPTGGDADLGTPNQACQPPGPGVGDAGAPGQPGANCIPEENILIIAEDDVDNNGDGLVDDPDDEAGGGMITIDFDVAVEVINTIILDQETPESVTIIAYGPGGTLLSESNPVGLGENSREDIPVNTVGVKMLTFEFSGSGGIATVVIVPPDTTGINLGAVSVGNAPARTGLLLIAGAILVETAFVLLRRRRRSPLGG
jgi:hypothetical protein